MKTDDSMTRMMSLATTLLDTKTKIADLKTKLGDLETLERSIEQEDLPTLMKELGGGKNPMTKFELADGTKIEVIDDITCGISDANRPEAHQWLRDNNFAGIIKTVLMQSYSASEIDEATANATKIEEATGRAAHVIETIHAQTLKAFLKEQRRKTGKGRVKLPTKLFGIYPFSKAKVTPPKERDTTKEG